MPSSLGGGVGSALRWFRSGDGLLGALLSCDLVLLSDPDLGGKVSGDRLLRGDILGGILLNDTFLGSGGSDWSPFGSSVLGGVLVFGVRFFRAGTLGGDGGGVVCA